MEEAWSQTDRFLKVPPERLLQDWKGAYERARSYLESLGVPEAERDQLATRAVNEALCEPVWLPEGHAVAETLRALWRLLPEAYSSQSGAPEGKEPPDPFVAWRLETALSRRSLTSPVAAPPFAPPSRDGSAVCSVPELTRGAMAAHRFERRGMRPQITRSRDRESGSGDGARGSHGSDASGVRAVRSRRRELPWTRIAQRRRALLAVLVLIPSVIASGFMVTVLPRHGGTLLEVAIVLFFGALFGWISIGFWTAMFGFLILTRQGDRFRITRVETEHECEIDRGARTAVVMPICEEPVDRVFSGMKAIYQSLERGGALSSFDLFVLSDTSDPGRAVHEEEAWFTWRRAAAEVGKVFYRRRRVRLERKSGNIADFCRRWGRQYRYMVVLDTDSMMSGDALVRLVGLMEDHPDVGMIQTAPASVNRRSLFARVQQFASRVYGPMFAAGLHFWQLGDGQYWGHNAIIRIEAFMAHCALPRLPGKPPLGGEILSHDFVEAALMGRGGWALWLAFDLPGSYEETPSSLLEEMDRDRRWCQGNLQHLQLLFTKDLVGAHRALFLNGVLSYVSALLWFCFLSLSTAEAIVEVIREPEYFPSGPSLFPEWPIWRPDWALWLVAVTAVILFVPKILGVILILLKWRNTRSFGGSVKLCLSLVFEVLISSLFAPIRMVFHTRFVLMNLVGRTVSWRSQQRGDRETGWTEALRHHGVDTVLASAWGAGVYWLNPEYFWWLTPIVVALILSVPLSVYASRVSLGDRARDLGLFMIPEEVMPPAELRDLDRNLREAEEAGGMLPVAERDGFVRAVVDPFVNALHCTLLRKRRSLRPTIRAARRALIERALAEGPAALTTRERSVLLSDLEMMSELHRDVWQMEDVERARLWGRPGAGQ